MTDRMITSATVREQLGNVSDMTIWRWLNDPAMGFPQPIKIQSRRYWREAEIKAWLDAKTPARTAA